MSGILGIGAAVPLGGGPPGRGVGRTVSRVVIGRSPAGHDPMDARHSSGRGSPRPTLLDGLPLLVGGIAARVIENLVSRMRAPYSPRSRFSPARPPGGHARPAASRPRRAPSRRDGMLQVREVRKAY